MILHSKIFRLFLFISVLFFFTKYAVATTVLILGIPAPLGTQTVDVLERFSKTVKDKSNGGIVVKVFPNAAFGNNLAHVEGVAAGTVDMAVVVTAALSDEYEKLQILRKTLGSGLHSSLSFKFCQE